MHDTSTQSMSRWKAVGARKNESSILSPTPNFEARKESRKYRPSKQKELSNSKIFATRNRSRIDSLDNIPKEDLNDSQIKEPPTQRTRRLSKHNQQISAPIVRVSSESNLPLNANFTAFEGAKQRKVSSFGAEKELIILKEDYNKFKQKILNQLEIQKQNIQNMINQILQTVRTQLMAIEEKYAKSFNFMPEQFFPIISEINIPQINGVGSKLTLGDISTINHIVQGQIQRTQSEKAIISDLTSVKAVEDDPISERFSKFYSAIEKLKCDLDCLHEISAVNGDRTQKNSPAAHVALNFATGKPLPQGVPYLKT